MLKKLFSGILILIIVTGCSDNEVTEEPQPDEEPETTHEEEPDTEDHTEPLELEGVTFIHDLWHLRDDVTFNIQGEVGPIIRDGDYAILPVTLDSEDDVRSTITGLFDPGVFTGEGTSSQQGLDIRIIDPEQMTTSLSAALLLEEDDYIAMHTFFGEGSRNTQITFGDNSEPARYYGVFTAPDTDSVHVLFRRLGVIEHIPVVDREDVGALTIDERLGELSEEEREELSEDDESFFSHVIPSVEEIIERELDRAHISAEYDGDLARVQASVFPIESYQESIVSSVSRIDEIQHSTLMISSDVLFDFDSAQLMEEADEELAAAADVLVSAEGGELVIVGHTDNDGTEEYNQQLSEDRAESVQVYLENSIDLDAFDVEFRGESLREPIADNESEEGRALNRRVDIHFTPPAETIEVETETDMPEVLGDEVEYPSTIQNEDGEIEIESIKRVDDLFVGRITVRYLEDVGSSYNALNFGFGRPYGARGWHVDDSVGQSQFTAYAPTIIHGDQRYFPLDYYLAPLEGTAAEDWVEQAEEDEQFIVPLAERYTGDIGRLDEGGYYTSTIVWPAVESDTVTVDLTVPYRFLDDLSDRQIEQTHSWRITDVPVDE
ncbi:outer membrane protein A precursor [Geomicrobium sp. JCM 19037]|uniref:OmpA family protein n=1 Tax=Geomicrobium sp. JCM 19037 TaxID=1460634 RepID=UPI00045F3C52|nr:OmpA family protein [Geomicrobium sp. JCM 19037]GAK03498.1 outer membrane protein A precursor [Geomicrobium sp. JCM 19037]